MATAITIVLGWIALDAVLAVVWAFARGLMKQAERRPAAAQATARRRWAAGAREHLREPLESEDTAA